MKQKIYGYIRVSTLDQNEDRQLIALREKNIPRGHLYIDRQSGKDFLRPRYQKLVKRLRRGDLLYRPPGPQLCGDSGAVAGADKGEGN